MAFQSKVKQLTACKKDVCMISDVMLKQMFPDQSAVYLKDHSVNRMLFSLLQLCILENVLFSTALIRVK